MIKVKCNNCGKIHCFEENGENDSIIFEHLNSYERQMGAEQEYQIVLNNICDECDNEMAVEFYFWEYPQMVLNYSDYEEDGCVVLEEPNYKNYLVDNNESEEYDEE